MADDERARELLDAGLRLLRSWDHEGAARAFTEAIELDPTLVEAYESRAVAHRRLGRDEEADEDIATSRAILRDGQN
jgi:Flp pilus assembly protein TadD